MQAAKAPLTSRRLTRISTHYTSLSDLVRSLGGEACAYFDAKIAETTGARPAPYGEPAAGDGKGTDGDDGDGSTDGDADQKAAPSSLWQKAKSGVTARNVAACMFIIAGLCVIRNPLLRGAHSGAHARHWTAVWPRGTGRTRTSNRRTPARRVLPPPPTHTHMPGVARPPLRL